MAAYQPRSMLVTGGAGFIGANFIRYVLKTNPHITIENLDKLTYAGSLTNLSNLPHANRHHFIQGDIADESLVSHILQHHHIDTIVHFAAESHVDRSITEPARFVTTNVVGTFVLLEAARRHWYDIEECDPARCRFHHISTDEVYGSLGLNDAPFNEEKAYQPRSPYSATKAGSDHLVAAYYHTYGLPITLSHCSNNYGPYRHKEKFIPTIILGCLNGQPIPIYGNGKQIRDWIYVTDHCRGIMTILQQGQVGECYHLGGHQEWENRLLAQYVCKQMDQLLPQSTSYQTLLQFVKDRPGHDFRYAMDTTKIRAQLGWEPQETFADGIKKTIRFYQTLVQT